MTAYDQGYWYPTGSYWRDYDGNYQAYPFSDAPNGPRYRIVDGMHVYEPYYYGGAYATVGVPTERSIAKRRDTVAFSLRSRSQRPARARHADRVFP